MYQPVLSSMYTFFTTKTLGKNLSVESLELMMSVLLGLMADNKLTSGDDGQYTKVINGICLRILERTDFTKLNWYDVGTIGTYLNADIEYTFESFV